MNSNWTRQAIPAPVHVCVFVSVCLSVYLSVCLSVCVWKGCSHQCTCRFCLSNSAKWPSTICYDHGRVTISFEKPYTKLFQKQPPKHVLQKHERNEQLEIKFWLDFNFPRVTGAWNTSKALWRCPVVSGYDGLAILAQEANSWDPGSIPGRNTSFDVPESSFLLSGPWIQLESRHTKHISCKVMQFNGSVQLLVTSPLTF